MMYFGERMPTSLINANQMRANGHVVEDCPQQFDAKSSHSIKTRCGLDISLSIRGVISYIPMRKPTANEIATCPRIEMTSDMPWDPHSQELAQAETIALRQAFTLEQTSKQNKQPSRNPLTDQTNKTNTDHALARAQYFNEHRNIAACSIADDNLLYNRLLIKNPIADSVAGDNFMGTTQFDNENGNRTVYCCERAAKCAIGTCCESCLNPTVQISAINTKRSKNPISSDQLASRWKVGEQKARDTLNVTTQKGIRHVRHPVEKRFKTQQPHLRKRRLEGKFYSDTLFFQDKSIRGYKCAQMTTDGKGFGRFWAMERKEQAHEALNDLIQTDGAPDWLITDNALEQGGGPFTKSTMWQNLTRIYHIRQTFTEPHSSWQNSAEGEIREAKRSIKRFTRQSNSPKRLWCFLGEHVTNVRRVTASAIPSLRGRTPHESVLGWTPDISNFIQHDWWQWVYYLDQNHEQKLGKWLTVAMNHGGGDAYWILPESCHPIVVSTVWNLPDEDMLDPEKKTQREDFTQAVEKRLGNSIKADETEEFQAMFPDYGDLFEEADGSPEPFEPEAEMPETDEYTEEAYDQYLTAEVLLPRNGEEFMGTVRRRSKDEDGKPIGKRASNPILDTRQYEVEFPDGSVETYNANLIAENLYSQIDDEGRQFQLIDEILDHRKDGTAVCTDDGTFTDRSGKEQPRRTTKGWELLLSWKDGTSDWVKLKDMKDSYPIEVAQYAVGNKISSEPAFNWWVPYVMRKKDRMISKVKSKYWKRSHKFGIRLPKTVEQAIRFDEEDGTTFWRDAVEKEMKNVRVAFEFNDQDSIPVAHKEVRCHWVFDVKMASLQRKARLVANGNETEAPKDITFSSVVSRDSVRLFFLLAALNDMDILSCDIQNAYLTAQTKEKLWTRVDAAFGSDKGRPAKIVRALYGLKASGSAFRSHLAGTLRTLGFVSSKADPDVWMRASVKADGTKFYEYVLCYVDDVLCSSTHPKGIMDSLSHTFTLKEGTVKEPDLYLGADVKKWYIEGSDEPGKVRWAMSSTNYTKKAIEEVERELREGGLKLPTKVTTPLSSGYRPEIDATAELDDERQNYFQGLIGVLRWICELGRIDLLTPVSLLSRYLVSARRGHLEQVFHIFAYLKAHERSTLVFDDTDPSFDGDRFNKCDWSEFYPDAAEAIPTDMPEPRGKSVSMSCFVDADHAGCRVTRRSHTGVLIFVNRAPILWYSKRQNTVESSTFGSEFVAAKTAIEMVEGLRYKLRMMGVTIDGPTNLFCDNDSVVQNSSNPESTLKKKHNAIAYHRTREAIAAGTIRMAKEDGMTNLADILTKLMPGPRLKALISRILW
jgi:hypothetical protein